MDAKRRKAALASILLSTLAGSEARPDAPSINTAEKFCRGPLYGSSRYPGLALKTQDLLRPRFCSKPVFGGHTAIPSQCWTGEFTDLEGASAADVADRPEAGTIPAKYFHFLKEDKQ